MSQGDGVGTQSGWHDLDYTHALAKMDSSLTSASLVITEYPLMGGCFPSYSNTRSPFVQLGRLEQCE